MEDAAVEFLLENLKQLQLHHSHLIPDDATNQIQVLETNLCLFKRLLNDSTDQNRDKDETLDRIVSQIVQVVYEAEDAVDAMVSQAAEKGVEKYFKRAFDASAKLLSVVKQVELIGAEVKYVYDHNLIDFSSLEIKGEFYTWTEQKNLHEDKVPTVEKDTMVGFEDDVDRLIHYLTEKPEELGVITIGGMGGLGKTTLARHIFRHERIANEFPTRLWVYISQSFRKRDVYLAMLRDLNFITDDMHDKTDGEIEQTLRARLEKEKCFIVFDDLWAGEHWDDLRDVLPKSNTGSKILITSRFLNLCRYANSSQDHLHELRFLNEEESWMLLQLTVFGEAHKCPSDLENLGRSIANLCQGLPFSLILLGGILGKTASAGEMHKTWEKVYKDLTVENVAESTIYPLLLLSYNMLPCYLRPCLMYMGMFPEDFEIPVHRLILLWIAEGFVHQKADTTITLEEIAMEYLKELIDRKLVTTGKVSLTGRIKTCRLHDLIRDTCLHIAQKYFFREIAERWDFKHGFDDLDKYRYISVNFDVVSFISLEPYGPLVRTFLHFLREETILLPENVSFISDNFKLLRVLDVKPIRFTRFPFYLTQLIHLRYIALSSNFKVLPEAMSKMWNIQTLIVGTSSRTLEIKADIWKMNQLRHLETNASIILRKNTTGGSVDDKGEKMQTLYNISPESCVQVFKRATNLKKLGIRGQLAMLMDHDKDGSTPFDGLNNLRLLEKLKLLNDVFANPHESQLPGLPPPNRFPPKLRSLTLSYTFLDWKHMRILGMLENLKVLKLKNNAFTGECWEAADSFHQLEVLQVEYTNLVVWKASSTHFPKLKYLALRNCEKLEALPLSLADVSSLQVIDLYRTTKSAAASAKKIQAHTGERGLKLSIFPRDE